MNFTFNNVGKRKKKTKQRPFFDCVGEKALFPKLLCDLSGEARE